MPRMRKRKHALTEAERRIMNILWDRGGATAGEVHEVLSKTKPVAYTTAQKMLQVLRAKKLVDGEMRGRAVFYTPLIERDAAQRDALKSLADTLFQGSDEALALHLIENAELSSEALARLEARIDEAIARRRRDGEA